MIEDCSQQGDGGGGGADQYWNQLPLLANGTSAGNYRIKTTPPN